jgi:membrane protein required for beta-lactamase induction
MSIVILKNALIWPNFKHYCALVRYLIIKVAQLLKQKHLKNYEH